MGLCDFMIGYGFMCFYDRLPGVGLLVVQTSASTSKIFYEPKARIVLGAPSHRTTARGVTQLYRYIR